MARTAELATDSVNLFSHFQAEMGVGEISRRLIALLAANGINLNVLPFEASKSRKLHPPIHSKGVFDPEAASISCVNPDQLGSLVAQFGIPFGRQNPHVGFWAWELEDFPKLYKSAANLLNEIWTISNFAKLSIASSVTTPVKSVRMPVPIPTRKTSLNRKHFKLPGEGFLATTSFDFNSNWTRKNPAGAILAFKQAFPKVGQATLAVKSINGDKNPDQWNQLLQVAENRKDIIFLDGYLNHYENQALLELADVFLSLHRAEGYGINLADSMARGTPVVATGYSGNLDYMDQDSAILVPFTKAKVTNYAGLKVQSQWAEPDLDFASGALRELAENSVRRAEIGRAGFRRIAQDHSLSAAANFFRTEFMNG